MAGIAQPLFPHSSTSSVYEQSDSPSAIFDLHGLHNRTEQSAATNTISPTNSSTTNVTSNFTSSSSYTSQGLLAKEHLSLFEKARLVIGDHDAAQSVIDVQYYYRCSGLVGSCVHIPSLKRTLNRLFYYPAASSSSAESVGEAELAVLLLALALSIQFTPRGMYEKSQLEFIDALGPDLSPVERQHELHSLAKAILQRLMFNSDASLAQVQACIMIVVYDLDDTGFKDGMLWNARFSIERWMMHQIIFVTMLEFYEVPQRIGEPVSPIMLALANHILDLQGRIRHHCDVVDSLKVNVDGADSDVTDRFWEGVMAFLDKPMEVLDQMF
ncbi:hypothetical protein EX895_000273 [Sporisorium graminicola]|uniref:Uncharacterized protein n=1 Tax=Sporisorium graminicola TaxID=280036 RepID=A0A4U7KZK6_9BASI|nr:hypothetical protein EX895_000273 [Sporisorium graminicola]TKY90275.1 hypothetical protein EX895_000273 [Sporisorium graminicola]